MIRDGAAVSGFVCEGGSELRRLGWSRGMAGVVAALGVGATGALGNINVEFRPSGQVVETGDFVGIGVYVVSDSAQPQLLSAAQVILGWDPLLLRLTGNSNAGAVPLLFSGFPMPDPNGLNEANPPQDGLGVYLAFANFGSPVAATPAGTLLTTLMFEALAETPGTPVDIVARAGNPPGRTAVLDGTVPNRDVTGTLSGAVVTVIPAPGAALGLGMCCLVAGRRRR